jgi:hypothetical protein
MDLLREVRELGAARREPTKGYRKSSELALGP